MILFTRLLTRLNLVFRRHPAADCGTMFPDPIALTTENWQDIHVWLTFFWIYVPVVFTFGVTLLTAHAVIPSLIRTKHIPESANKARLPLTAFAGVLLVIGVILMVNIVISAQAVEKFYDRYFF